MIKNVPMNSIKTSLTLPVLIVILATSSWSKSSIAYGSTITSLGVYRFETQADWPNNGQPITETGGKVFTTDAKAGLRIGVVDAQDGETITWNFFRPDGSLKGTTTIQYDRETDCWTGGIFFKVCGDPNNPYLDDVISITAADITCEMTGVWIIELVNNGVLLFSESFELTQNPNGDIVILSPADRQDFDLGPQNFTATDPIMFAAQVNPPAPVDWDVVLEYKTSGERGPFQDQHTFKTQAGNTHDEVYQSMGGLLKVTAQAEVGGQTVRTCLTATITGVEIPDADITARLVDLYSRGATPRLMTGIAMKESSYRQFCIPAIPDHCTGGQKPIYGKPDERWPHESFDGGSHIGLMMVTTAMETAWDWLKNTKAGVDLFVHDKLHFASTNERYIRNGVPKEGIPGHLGLRTLTDVELENMALVLYGPCAPGTSCAPAPTLAEKLAKQYYIPQCIGGTVVPKKQDLECQGGTWEWVINEAGNKGGVDYANDIRANMK